MNPVIENDILHVSRVMRASILQCAPRVLLVDYWHARLSLLLDTPGMNELQRCTVMGLRRELVDIDTRLRTALLNKPIFQAEGGRSAMIYGDFTRRRANAAQTRSEPPSQD